MTQNPDGLVNIFDFTASFASVISTDGFIDQVSNFPNSQDSQCIVIVKRHE